MQKIHWSRSFVLSRYTKKIIFIFFFWSVTAQATDPHQRYPEWRVSGYDSRLWNYPRSLWCPHWKIPVYFQGQHGCEYSCNSLCHARLSVSNLHNIIFYSLTKALMRPTLILRNFLVISFSSKISMKQKKQPQRTGAEFMSPGGDTEVLWLQGRNALKKMSSWGIWSWPYE